MAKVFNSWRSRRPFLLFSVIVALFMMCYLLTFDIDNERAEHLNPITVITSDAIQLQLQSRYDTDTQPPSNVSSSVNDGCPFFENVCAHKQRFYVRHQHQLFALHHGATAESMFGALSDADSDSFDIFRQVLNAQVWNQSKPHYCSKYSDAERHFILSAPHISEMDEFYTRIVRGLPRKIHDIANRNNKQFYVMLPNSNRIRLWYRMLMEPFSKYELQQFVDIFDHFACHCFSRLYFCGFDVEPSNNGYPALLRPLASLLEDDDSAGDDSNITTQREYQKWIQTHHATNLNTRVLEWKDQKLKEIFLGRRYYIENKHTSLNHTKFVAIQAQDHKHEPIKWQNYKTLVSECNDKLYEHNIHCFVMDDSFMHSMDAIISHQSIEMLIGASISTAVWMPSGFVVQIVDADSSNHYQWSALFANSTLSHVGVPILKDKHRDSKASFKVNTDVMLQIIEFLLTTDDALCNIKTAYPDIQTHLLIFKTLCS